MKINPRSKEDENRSGTMVDILAAAHRNNLSGVDLAINNDPTCINKCDPTTGLTALHLAVAQGNAGVVSYLLDNKDIQIDIIDNFGRDPLQIAIEIGHQEIIDKLSERMYQKAFDKLDI